MNFYQAVFPEKKLFRKYSQETEKAGFIVLTLLYLSFLVRAVTKKNYY